MNTAPELQDPRQSTVDRRRTDAEETARRVALMVEDRRSGNVRRAVDAERAYFDSQEKLT